MIRLNKKCFDPQSHLEKYGWQKGSGLGRSEDGIKEAIKVKIKNDTTGVGHDPGKVFSYHWWDHVFNKAANNIQVHNTEEGVQMTQVAAKSKKAKRKAPKDMLYGNFVKASTLTCSAEGVVETKVERDSSDSEDDVTQHLTRCTDEELFKLCGSRTAHKGARHGIKLSGKLQRLEEQERLATVNTTQPEQVAVVSHQHNKKKKKRKLVDEGDQCSTKQDVDNVNENRLQKDDLVSQRKKSRKHARSDRLVEPVAHLSKRKKKKKKSKD